VTAPDTGGGLARSYRPGDWFGIFGEQVTVVLPPSEKARVARVWGVVDDGAGFDEVLDALIADGLRELPGFVLVSEADGETKVVVRGAAHAEFVTDGETVTVEGSSVTTWAERSLTGLRAMRIEVADALGREDLVILDGLVRIARTDRPPCVGRAVPEPAGGSPVVGDLPAPSEASLPPGPGLPAPPEPAVQYEGAEEPVPPGDETAYFPMQEESPADGLTRAGNWSVGDSPARTSAQLAAPRVPAPPVARLTFSSGEVVEVDRPVVVGRAPEARRSTTGEPPTLVTVPSPHQEISSTHLEIRPGTGPDLGAAVVTDLASTNGTVVQQPGLPAEDLPPGVTVQLLPGAVLDLGDGVTIQVGPA
jgi:hypothetical protein